MENCLFETSSASCGIAIGLEREACQCAGCVDTSSADAGVIEPFRFREPEEAAVGDVHVAETCSDMVCMRIFGAPVL